MHWPENQFDPSILEKIGITKTICPSLFKGNIYQTEDAGCWIWTAGTNGQGFPTMANPSASGVIKVNKYIYEYQYNVFVDPGQRLYPTECRNRLCVRPDHQDILDHSSFLKYSHEERSHYVMPPEHAPLFDKMVAEGKSIKQIKTAFKVSTVTIKNWAVNFGYQVEGKHITSK